MGCFEVNFGRFVKDSTNFQQLRLSRAGKKQQHTFSFSFPASNNPAWRCVCVCVCVPECMCVCASLCVCVCGGRARIKEGVGTSSLFPCSPLPWIFLCMCRLRWPPFVYAVSSETQTALAHNAQSRFMGTTAVSLPCIGVYPAPSLVSGCLFVCLP